MLSASHSHVCTFIKSQYYNGTIQLEYLPSNSPLSPASYVSFSGTGTLAHEPDRSCVFPPGLELRQLGKQNRRELYKVNLLRLGHSLKKEILDSDHHLIQD